VAEGDVAGAEQRLEEFQAGLGGEERLALRRDVAWGWIAGGELDRADRLVANDSTVDGLALAGYIALFRGNVAGARELFQQAGPYAGTREEAAARTSLLALLQPMEADSLPALGTALLTLHGGDTTVAITQLAQVARSLPGAAGSGEVYLLMGKAAVSHGDPGPGEEWLREAAATGAPAAAPAAELELGRLLLGLGRPQEAAEILEHMILTYGDSALVPQARRLLDEARGGVPSI